MGTLMEQASKLLDFTQPFDIQLLDSVITCMYTGVGDQKVAEAVLTKLKEHPEAWTRVDRILEYSTNQQTKYYALQILEDVIKTRWKVLPRVQCEGIKKYIVGVIIKISSDASTLEQERVYLNKLNMILVQILKREWPKNWDSFIPDIVGASRTNESLCQNNMTILKLLSEEVFDFSSGQMTQTKAKHLKDTMGQEFAQIFQLCQFVMNNSGNPNLVGATLETLLRFLSWIPNGYIIGTELIPTLTLKFLNVPQFRNVTLKCLTEISTVTVQQHEQASSSARFIQLFSQTMGQLEKIIPLTLNICDVYATGSDNEQQFIQNLAMFLCTYLKKHGQLVEKHASNDLLKALKYLLLISEVEEVEIFKICLEYWNALVADLYREAPLVTVAPIFLGSPKAVNQPGGPRKTFYGPVLCRVRYIMITRMAKPEEVLVVENEHGENVREFMKGTDSVNLYMTMRETLVYLTHLDCADTERMLTKMLQNYVNGNEWSWKTLNTLCWAIGSISGAMHEEDEKRFIFTVMKNLLDLCEQRKGKDNRAVIASNLMYVAGQYPRFLRAHSKFLKTVVNQLFGCMHETHEGVQDMACDTFNKIARKCRRHFVTVQMGEVVPFIEEILSTTATIICDLQPQQIHTFYEAVGYMISAQSDQTVQKNLIEKYMSLPNQGWDNVIAQASSNASVLKDVEVIKQLGSILKTNVRACKALGQAYKGQLGRIYLEMLSMYTVMSDSITQAINLDGETATNQPIIKAMRLVKKETINLIAGWVTKPTNPEMVLDSLIPPLLEAILSDYQKTLVPSAREPEVLAGMATIVNKLEATISTHLPTIFDALFESTLNMINKDFVAYPEHRINFFNLLQAVNTHCCPTLLLLPPAQFKLVLDSIIWAFKHTLRNVADMGLHMLHKLLQNISSNDVAAQSFYQTYFTYVVQHILSVVTDTSHTAGLRMHSTILAHLFTIVEVGKVTVPLNGATLLATAPFDPTQNVTFVQEFVANLLKTTFPHLNDTQIKITVQGMFTLNQDVTAFKEHLRDFLVQIRELTGDDDSDLYLEEREASLKAADAEKRRIQMSVPGILNPHEISEGMEAE